MFWLLPFLVLLLDILTKWWTVSYLTPMSMAPNVYPYGGIPVFSNFFGIEFSLSYMTNRGAAWGLFGEWQKPLLFFRVVIVLFLIGYLAVKNLPLKVRIGFSLIIAGAVGNILDTFIYGHVIDMFHFVLWGYDFPVFNVADSAIFCGVVWLIGLSFL